jgi:hypothetical protein
MVAHVTAQDERRRVLQVVIVVSDDQDPLKSSDIAA